MGILSIEGATVWLQGRFSIEAVMLYRERQSMSTVFLRFGYLLTQASCGVFCALVFYWAT